ncbi:integrase arm-type DNA-binding domain-containing protein [Bradyrhizobium sp.]|uniref:tyrosine-type recombinase/integrase n=1 Tax=Bradyrhizobium sp. TaxID=376 RepID=UPI002629ECE8|nr:integrase arm-type DNA-binding domain-containing protein [Bradyrhizobium sp.]
MRNITEQRKRRAKAEPLKPADIKKAIASGKNQTLHDGASLSLKIRSGSALWIYKFRDGVSFRSTSLGSYHHGVGLTEARNKRNAFAGRRYEQRIPRRGLAVIKSAPEPVEPESEPDVPPGTGAKRMRFADVVDSLIAKRSVSEWKVKSREPDNYRRLKTGRLGGLWADEITHKDVEKELQTRWGDALTNAEKMRARIEVVLNHAIAKEARANDVPNPALKDIIKELIPAAPKSTPRAAMHRKDVPALMAELVADGSPSARALAFAILTVGRNVEARQADWSEIVGSAWIIPGGREERSMKEGQEHAVPLSAAALALLGKRKASGLIFGALPNHALNDKLGALRPNSGVTVHGFRTSFTSWAKAAGYSKEMRELAKAHAAGRTATELAYEHYDRADQLHTLRPMLQAWSDFATQSV